MERLDKYIQGVIENKYNVRLSRTFIDILLEKGGVILNDEIIKNKGFKFDPQKFTPQLKEDVIAPLIEEYQHGRRADSEASQWDSSDLPADMSLDLEKIERADDIRPHILYEDDNIVVTKKPANLLSHPGRGDQSRDSMVYQFIKYMRDKYQYIPRAGLLHRLDMETQGILLFAKNMQTYNEVKKDFEERRITKVYYAVVDALPSINNLLKRAVAEARKKEPAALKDFLISPEVLFQKIADLPTFDLEGYIGHITGGKKMFFDTDKNRLQRAHCANIKDCYSSVYVIGQHGKKIHLFVMPHTGRTHQIRAQLKYLNAVIINDHIYAPEDTRGGMLNLAAVGISFNLKGEKRRFALKTNQVRF